MALDPVNKTEVAILITFEAKCAIILLNHELTNPIN